MKDMPPSLASATARVSLDTDCIMAEIIGSFNEIAGVSPFLYLTSGVVRSTLSGVFSALE